MIKNFLYKINLFKNKLYSHALIRKIFNRSNLNKIILIFILGLLTRTFVYHIYNVNVFTDYLNTISLIYYTIFSMFIVLVHDIVDFFNVNIIPSYSYLSTKIFNTIKSVYSTIVSLNKIIFSHKLEDYKISSIRQMIRNYLDNKDNKNKIYFGIEETIKDNNEQIVNKLDPKEPVILQKNGHVSGDKKNTYSNETRVLRRTNGMTNIRDNRNIVSDSRLARPNIIVTDNNNNSSINNVFIPGTPVQSNTSNNINHADRLTVEGTIYPEKSRLYLPTDLLLRPTSSSYSAQTAASLINAATTGRYGYTETSIGSLPVTPVYSTLTTPSTMSPLFPSSNRSSYESNGAVYTKDGPSGNPHPYTVPGTVSYFNPSLISTETSKATIGLNGSNERLWLSSSDAPGPLTWTTNPGLYRNNSREIIWSDPQNVRSVDWTQKKDAVITNYNKKILEDNVGFSSKVVLNDVNYELPDEVILNKKGITGKIKVAFKYLDNKLAKTYSNMDNVAIKYHDKSKRKFVWVLWEKNSGSYESYEDFKNSWDPKTSIWAEIKSKTTRDIQADVEDILKIKPKRALEHKVKNRIEPIARRPNINREVSTLLDSNKPFTIPENESNHSSTHKSRRDGHHHKHKGSSRSRSRNR